MASTTTAPGKGTNSILILIGVAVIALLAVGAVFLMQDNRSGSERMGDAVEALPQGVDKAADELGDQPPAENIKRNAEKATN
ncbi:MULTISPECIES: hypothetical protein [Asticcacaulis]|jgi:flagellar basal body-associated protein FliL|uniref:Uncharacterized protein n=2 Tax=Asticcacaulis excentricus TaxID=78587 RepID=E8RSG6_ASTEC|nr:MULTISPECIES: hypothetical protein [Asticcacaulis]ADU14437.1 hypothetical protein Astex_2799 [Asticcacaulis excentricus CB 48]BBF82079.1 hypothetical protein EM6_2701 [Asticcacaulis excentricus]